MLAMLLVVGIGYLIDRFASAPDRRSKGDQERPGESP